MRRVEAAAARRAERVADELAAAIDVPGVGVSRKAGRVVLSGRGLARRAITDVRLRAIGLWLGSGR